MWVFGQRLPAMGSTVAIAARVVPPRWLPMKYAIELLERRLCHSGFLNLARYRLRHSLYGGGWSRVIERERVEYLNAAAVLLYDPLRDQVVMVEQFRVGALELGQGAWLVEPAGGVVDPGCDPAEVALREAREETGCDAWGIEPIASFHVSPGVSAQRLHLFCACTDASRAGGVHGVPGEGEDIRVLVLDACHAIAQIGATRLDTMPAIIALQWLALNRQRLRTRRGPSPSA
jgi:ADP-ribose pyrophosphatase